MLGLFLVRILVVHVFVACFMSLNNLLHSVHLFVVIICLIGFVWPWLLHWCMASFARVSKASVHAHVKSGLFCGPNFTAQIRSAVLLGFVTHIIAFRVRFFSQKISAAVALGM